MQILRRAARKQTTRKQFSIARVCTNRRLIRDFGLFLAIISWCSVFAHADEPELPKFKHRITGLFSRDREEDLKVAVLRIEKITLVSIDFDHAEAEFRYDPAMRFPGAKPEQIPEQFDNLLRNATNHTLGIKPLVTTPKDKLKSIEIGVVGLDCQACCLAVYEIVAQIDGVTQATASFKEGRVTALIDAEKTEKSALEQALKSRGVTLKSP